MAITEADISITNKCYLVHMLLETCKVTLGECEAYTFSCFPQNWWYYKLKLAMNVKWAHDLRKPCTHHFAFCNSNFYNIQKEPILNVKK